MLFSKYRKKQPPSLSNPRSQALWQSLTRDACSIRPLYNNYASIHDVNSDETTLEERVVPPASGERDIPSTRQMIILRIRIEIRHLLDPSASRILLDRPHIKNAES